MAFDDLLLPDAQIVGGMYLDYVVGDSLFEPVVIVDEDGSTLNLSSGYTASLTLNRPNGANVLVFTQTTTGGRVLDLSANAERSIAIRSTSAGMVTVAPYVGSSLRFNLTVTRTSDSLTATVMRSCYLTIHPKLD